MVGLVPTSLIHQADYQRGEEYKKRLPPDRIPILTLPCELRADP
jgi:hypothetical protein